MKKLQHLIVAGFFCWSASSQPLYAQNEKIGRTEWLEQMKQEERRVSAFVNDQMKNSALNDSLKQLFLSIPQEEDIDKANLSAWSETRLKNYYREQYIKAHPDFLKKYNPGRVSLAPRKEDKGDGAIGTNILCAYGDFESATPFNLGTQGYTGYEDPSGYNSGGVCNFVPPTNVAYNNVGFGIANNFLVTNNIPDPYVPALTQTHNGSKHAIRINAPTPCLPSWSINMLQKSLYVPSSGKARINFSYAMVAENPPYDHLGANTFFLARVLDASGTEVGTRICIPSGLPLFQYTPTKACGDAGALVIWKDWTCAYMEFDAQAGKTYTIEFFVADCSGGKHFAYAYVDDICADITCCPNVPPAPKNLDCVPTTNNSNLSWDPVPGAVYYKVSMSLYDPICCPGPSPVGFSTVRNTSTPNLTVPNTLAHCFSWKVQAVMPDSCRTDFSDNDCSCTPPSPPPTGLDCNPATHPDGSALSWNPVAGAVYYKVSISTYDPICCSGPSPIGFSTVRNTSVPNLVVPNTLAHCFSWKVLAVMPDSSRSEFSNSECSCTPPPPPPTGLDCDPATNPIGSNLTWNPVAGAVYYKVSMTLYDPACCPGPNPIGFSTVRNTTIPSLNVPNTLAYCFSWKVQAVFPDSSRSLFSVSKCSCTPSREGEGGKAINSGGVTIENSVFVSAVPNPASEHITFTVQDKNNRNTSGQLRLHLYDVNGKEIIRKDMNGHQLRLDVRSYADGVYIYEIRNKNKTLFKNKVAIEKH